MASRPRTNRTRVNRESTGPRIDQAPASGSDSAGPLERLTSFHVELRAALAALSALFDDASTGAPDARAAQRLVELFTGPLLWHDEDEEVGLLPRLRRLALGETERAIIDATSGGHDRMEELLEHLGPLLSRMAAGTCAREDVDAGAAQARALRNLLDAHMKLEEEALFPLAAQRLGHDELEALGREMDARHGDANVRPRRAIEL